MLAIVGGSGLDALEELAEVRRVSVRTAFGEPSAALTFGRLGSRELVFLPRHGEAHSVPPHRINYRANMRALKDAGVREIVAVAAVGGIRSDFGPGVLVVPDQLIDYTWGRPSSFFEDPGTPVTHVDFTEPYTAALRERILAAATACGEAICDGGTYAVTQGPRLETAAEIAKLERDGAHLVGMTAMPEAVLAREAGMDYASIAVVVNHAAGKGSSREGISLAAIDRVLKEAMARVRRVIRQVAA